MHWRHVEAWTTRFANHLWRLRDGHVSKLHSSVPKQTKESLWQAPLLGKHLFPEETVALAGQNLRGDVQHQNLSKSLKLFTAVKQSASKKASSHPNFPTQQPPKAARRGTGVQTSRAKSNKSSKGWGRGRIVPDSFLTSAPLHCPGVVATAPGLRFWSNHCLH